MFLGWHAPRVAAVSVLGWLAVKPVQADPFLVKRMSLAERVEAADAIFSGDLSRTVSANLGNGTLATQLDFRNVDWLKGGNGEPAFVVQIAGGKVGGRRMHLAEAPDFVSGCSYLLFLDNHLYSPFPFAGAWQGVFQLLTTPDGSELVIEGHGDVVFSRGGHGVSQIPGYGLGHLPGRDPVDISHLWRTPATFSEMLSVVRRLARDSVRPTKWIEDIEFGSFSAFRKRGRP